MKFTTIAAMLLISGATEVDAAKARGWDDDVWSQDSGLAQIVTSAISRSGPKTITVPKKSEKGKALTESGSGGAFEDGRYINTTRKADGQDYLYMWRHQCKFTKWTPTNQYLHNKGQKSFNSDYQDDKITLERFGFVGYDRRCFWGMIGVHWKKPIKIFQYKGQGSSKTVQILQEDNHKMCLGFPGKEVNGQKVMQVGKLDQPQGSFQLKKVKKGNFLIEVYSDEKKVLDVQHGIMKDKAPLVANLVSDKSTTQVWKLNEDEETLISDSTGTWCLTRTDDIKESEKLSHKSNSTSSNHTSTTGHKFTIHKAQHTYTTHTTHTTTVNGKTTTHTTHHSSSSPPKKSSKLGLDFGSVTDFLGLSSDSEHAPKLVHNVVIEKCTSASNQYWLVK